MGKKKVKTKLKIFQATLNDKAFLPLSLTLNYRQQVRPEDQRVKAAAQKMLAEDFIFALVMQG